MAAKLGTLRLECYPRPCERSTSSRDTNWTRNLEKDGVELDRKGDTICNGRSPLVAASIEIC